jgi:putative transposase
LCKLSKLLTEARARSAWLREGSQVAQQQTLRTYAQALGHAYAVKGRRKPVVKHRKRALPSLEHTRRGSHLHDRRLCLPRGVSIPSPPFRARAACDLSHKSPASAAGNR